MAKEKKDKYIFYLAPNKYRILIKINSQKKNLFVNFSELFYGSLTEARKYRDLKLKEFGALETEKKNATKYKAVSKYIYDYGKGSFRILIKSKGKVLFSEYYTLPLNEVEKIRDEELAKIKLYGPRKNSNITFKEFWQLWYESYAKKETAYNTYTKDRDNLRLYVSPVLDNIKLKDIDVLTLQTLFSNLKFKKKSNPTKYDTSEYLSPVTINEAYKTLRKILKKAVEWGYMEKSPLDLVPAPKVTKKEKTAFNIAELKNVFDLLEKEIDIVNKLAIYIPIFLGLRRGEIVGIKVNKIDFKNNTISIENSVIYNKEIGAVVNSDTKTEDSVRVMPAPQILMDTLKEYLIYREKLVKHFRMKNEKNYKPPDNLFLSRFGKIMNPSTPYKKWTNFRDKNGIVKHVTLHGLRHTYCSLQVNDNPDLSITDVQYLMGHKSLFTTLIYTHKTEDKKNATVAVFDKITGNKNKQEKFSFESVLSICLGTNFTSTDKIINLANHIVNDNTISIKDKLELSKQYIQSKYQHLLELQTKELNLNNIWDWLETKKNHYGSEFEIQPINNEDKKKLIKELKSKQKEELVK